MALVMCEFSEDEAHLPEPLITTTSLENVMRVAAARSIVEAEECPATIAESTRPTVALFQGEPWV